MSAETNWERNIEIDLGLAEVRDCPDEHWTMRALAGASVGVDPEDALSAAAELSGAVGGLMAGHGDAKASLATILGACGNDYQRCLWYVLAGRDPLGTSVDLGRLVELLAGRAVLARDAAVNGTGVRVEPDPYVTDQVDGPTGLRPAGLHHGGCSDASDVTNNIALRPAVDELAGIGMLRIGEHRAYGALLHQMAVLHHRDAVGEFAHQVQVVRDQ